MPGLGALSHIYQRTNEPRRIPGRGMHQAVLFGEHASVAQADKSRCHDKRNSAKGVSFRELGLRGTSSHREKNVGAAMCGRA